jgi:hypothetical protein
LVAPGLPEPSFRIVDAMFLRDEHGEVDGTDEVSEQEEDPEGQDGRLGQGIA